MRSLDDLKVVIAIKGFGLQFGQIVCTEIRGCIEYMLKIFCEIFEKKNRINQASLSKRTCVLNEISKFHKKISNLFFKNFQKLKMKFEIFL